MESVRAGGHPGGRLAVGARIAVGSIGTVLLLLAAVTVAAALTGTVAALLPGVTRWDTSPEQVWVMAFTTAVLAGAWCGYGVLFVSALEGAPIKGRALPAATVHAVRRFASAAGLIGGRRPPVLMVGVGALAGVVAVAQSAALTRWPLLAATASGPDVRIDAIVDAPSWVQSIYFALYAPLWEEVAYRGLLLLVVAYLPRLVAHDGLRRCLVVTALLVSAFAFGATHAEYSLLNAVTAGVDGLVFGATALWARSVWPGVVGHTLVNLWVGLLIAQS